MIKCPTCRSETSRERAGKLFPFCSQRCWATDLGKWLGGDYRVPDEGAPPASRDPESD